jgi:hypothetical protein
MKRRTQLRNVGVVANPSAGGDNRNVSKKVEASKRNSGRVRRKSSPSPESDAAGSGPFRGGTIVLATLREPREKVWGALLALDTAGVSLQGVELSSFEDATSAVVAGEPLNAAVVFFPMHRVERIAMDLPEGSLPSLSQRFRSRTGLDPQEALAQAAENAAGGSADA